MSSLAALQEKVAVTASPFDISEGALDVQVRTALARMIAWCMKNPQGATFLARGMVVDTMGDIARQITGYFPAHIDVSPVLDDIALVVGESAAQSGQRFQEVELDYIADGKIPQAAQANLQTLVKWYGVDSSITGGSFDGHNKNLKPGWSGGASTPTDMLKNLQLGSKKGFLLQVRALDIKDAKTAALLADLPIMQAFGGSPAVLAAAVETIAAGGAGAKQIQAIAEQIAEIKTIRAALTNAGDTPAATPIATALAVKAEMLATQIAEIKTTMPAPVHKNIVRGLEVVKTDLQVRQIASAIETLAAPRMVAALPAAIGTAAAAVQSMARAQNLPVRDAVAMVIAQTAPMQIVAPVKTMASVMSKPAFLPAIEKALPPAAAASIRAALTTPATQAVAQAPAKLDVIAGNIAAISEKVAMPTVRMAALAVEQAARPLEPQIMAPSLRAPALQAVAENLRAVTMTQAVPESVKPALKVASAQVEAAVIQMREPAPQAMPSASAPLPLPTAAPLAVLATAVNVVPPATIPPAPAQPAVTPPIAAPVTTSAAPAAPANPTGNGSQPAANGAEAKAPDGKMSPVTFTPPAKPQEGQPIKAEQKKAETAKGPCPDCKKGFNCATCVAETLKVTDISSSMFSAMNKAAKLVP